MVSKALKPIQHVTAWIVWHSTKKSMLPDLREPKLPE